MKIAMILLALSAASLTYAAEFTYSFAPSVPVAIRKQFESAVRSFAAKNDFTVRRVRVTELAFVRVTNSLFNASDAELNLIGDPTYLYSLDFNYYAYGNWSKETARAGWVSIEAMTRMLPVFLISERKKE